MALKTKNYTFYKRAVERYEANIPLIEEELKTDRSPSAILGNYGFTFYDDIDRLLEYLEETGREETAEKLKQGKTKSVNYKCIKHGTSYNQGFCKVCSEIVNPTDMQEEV